MSELTKELCRKLRGCFHTGVKEEYAQSRMGGTVLPTIPQAFQGVDVRFEDEDKDDVVEISIYPIRTAEEGVMNFDLKNIVALFEPLISACGRCIDNEKATLDFTGYYCNKLFRIQLYLTENIKEQGDAS